MRLRLIERFLALPGEERVLLLRAIVTLGLARIGLWIMPVKHVRRLLAPSTRRKMPTAPTPARIGWAVGASRRVVPKATCLPQALACESLLTRFGYDSQLRIGVTKTTDVALEAHAWVECQGRIVIGDLEQGLSGFTALPPLPGPR